MKTIFGLLALVLIIVVPHICVALENRNRFAAAIWAENIGAVLVAICIIAIIGIWMYGQ